MERAADEKLGDRCGRVEAARRFAFARRPRERRGRRGRLVLEHSLVDRPKLLDAQVVIRDALAACARLGGGQGQHHLPHDRVRHVPPVNERRIAWRKQPPVERRDIEVSGATSRMRHSRDRLERVPQPACVLPLGDPTAHRVNRVGIAVDLVPHRDQPARFREQQKEHAIDDGERLIEGRLRWCRASPAGPPAGRPKGNRQLRQRREDAITQRPAHLRRMSIGIGDRRRERGQRSGMPQRIQRRRASWIVDDRGEGKIDRPPRPRTRAIDHADRPAVRDHRPPRAGRDATPESVAPSALQMRRPRHDGNGHRWRAGYGTAQAPAVRRQGWCFMSQEREQRTHRHVEDRPGARRRS